MHRPVWYEKICSTLEQILRSDSLDSQRRRFRKAYHGTEIFESRLLLSTVRPYLQNPAPDAMTVIWFTETNTAGTLTVNLPGGGNLQFNSTPEFKTELAYAAGEAATGRSNAPWMHRIRVTGLQEGTSYNYSVTQGLETYTGQMKTIPGKTSDVRFVVYADSETEPESTGKKVQWTVPDHPNDARLYIADQTVGYTENLKVIESRNPDFIGIAGDLVESGGEQRDWDEFWRHNAGSINDVASSVPIFAAPGNHEVYGGPGGFGAYTDAGSNRAKGKFQTYWEAPSNGTGGYDDRYYRIDYGPITYISLDVTNGKPHGTGADTNWLLGDGPGYPDFNPGSIQYEWLESQLADAQANSRFTFVQFHHVPYSTGPHGFPAGNGGNAAGFDNQSGVPVRVLTPLFAQYGVDAVLSGHDETYQHSIVNGIHFYDVGIGGDGLRGPSSGEDSNNDEIETNPFQEFTAHLNAPEVWNGAQLVSGGKHYGHMEINVTFDPLAQTWEAKLEPVYVFPLMNSSGIITGWERRVYDDVTILTASEPAAPTVTLSSSVGSVAEAGGSITLTATLSSPATEDVFVYLQTNGTAVNNTDYRITSSAAPIAIDGDFSDWHNNPAIHFGTDPLDDTHDTDASEVGETPAYINHPDVDLRAFGVTHDEQNLYFYFRSEGQIGRTQVANPALSKAAGRYYVIVTMDVDQNDVTGYELYQGGYHPSTPGYDMNSEVEFFGGTFNTGHYLNHGATDLDTLNDAFADQSYISPTMSGYNPALAGQDIQGPFTPGFVRIIPGSYDYYTQWVYKDDDPANGGNDSITFVKDKGSVVTGIIQQRVSADGHELEMIVPYKGFLVDQFGNPIVDVGKILDLSFSLEASGELAPGHDWASDTANPLDGYELTAPSTLPVNFIRIPKGQISASVDLTATNNLIVSPDRVAVVGIESVVGAVEDGVQEVAVNIVNDDAPQIQTTPGTLSYSVGSPAVVIDAGLTSVAAAGSTYTEATVSVGAEYVAGDDILEFVSQAGITGSFNSTSGVLTFTGTADPSAYQNILRSVTYKNVGGSPANLERTVTFTVSSGSLSGSDTRMIQLMNVATPSLSINNITVTEGNSGTVNATFTVTLSAASGQTVTVDFATADGTALQPGDYTSNSGPLTFAPGETTRTITVAVKGDVLDETNETYVVNLSNASNATISDNQGLGTITDDDTADSPPTDIDLSNSTVVENAGANAVIGTLSASDPDAGETFTFSLPMGLDDNSEFNISGTSLRANASFDFEVNSSYTVTVRVADSIGLTIDKTFSITVTYVMELDAIDVQNGQAQRSFVRYLDLVFDSDMGLLDLINPGRLQLTKFDLNGANGVMVPLPDGAGTSVSGTRINVDFGAQGIGGSRNTNAGDGYYEISVDMDDNGSFETTRNFFRLFGDVTGDGTLNSADKIKVLQGNGTTSAESDVNGDGLVNVLDTALMSRAIGKKIKNGLFWDD